MNLVNELYEVLELASSSTLDEVNKRMKFITGSVGGDSFGHAVRQACASIRAIPGNARKDEAIAYAKSDIDRVIRLQARSLEMSS